MQCVAVDRPRPESTCKQKNTRGRRREVGYTVTLEPQWSPSVETHHESFAASPTAFGVSVPCGGDAQASCDGVCLPLRHRATSKPGIWTGVQPHGHGACAVGSGVGGLKISRRGPRLSAVMMLIDALFADADADADAAVFPPLQRGCTIPRKISRLAGFGHVPPPKLTTLGRLTTFSSAVVVAQHVRNLSPGCVLRDIDLWVFFLPRGTVTFGSQKR